MRINIYIKKMKNNLIGYYGKEKEKEEKEDIEQLSNSCQPSKNKLLNIYFETYRRKCLDFFLYTKLPKSI